MFPTRPLLPVESHIIQVVRDVVQLCALTCSASHFFYPRVWPIRLVNQQWQDQAAWKFVRIRLREHNLRLHCELLGGSLAHVTRIDQAPL